jgi:tRNA(fMet)-specific endonuclease VapC
VTLAELEFGIACSAPTSQPVNRAALDSLLEDILVAPFDSLAAKAYGPIRAAYKDRNRNALDKLIASHAVSLELILVTNNEADFVSYPGLVVENWVMNH